MIHVGESGRIHGSGASLVDFNRGGTPLVEIVTEPDLRGAAEAREWAQLLRTTVRQLGVSDVNMEEGSLRVDANVSVRPRGRRGARHEDRAQEHEQLPLPRARDRGRARAPGGAARRRGGRSTQETLHFDPRDGLADAAALEGVRARLPLLPRARPGAAGADRGDAREARARRCPSCPRRAASATGPSSASRGDRAAARLRRRARRVLRARPRGRPMALEPRDRRQLGHRASWPRLCARRATRRRGAEASTWLTRWPHGGSTKRICHASGARGRCARCPIPAAGGDPAEIVEREGWGRSRTRASSRRSSTRGDRGRARGRRAGPRRQREGDRPDRRRRDAGDQGPRRRRRGHAPDPGAAGRRLAASPAHMQRGGTGAMERSLHQVVEQISHGCEPVTAGADGRGCG